MKHIFLFAFLTIAVFVGFMGLAVLNLALASFVFWNFDVLLHAPYISYMKYLLPPAALLALVMIVSTEGDE